MNSMPIAAVMDHLEEDDSCSDHLTKRDELGQDSTPDAKVLAQPYLVAHLSSQESVDDAPAQEWKAGKHEWLIMLCLFVVSLVVALDATILVTAFPVIANALGASTLSTFWIGTSYLLTHAVVQPIISALSEIFGRRSLLLASVILFTVGSILASLAHGVDQMLAGRVVQGAGGGGIIVLGQVIVTDIVPLRQRPKFLALSQMAWAVGSISGPLIGGAIAEHTTWRWIFYLNFPFCGIGLLMIPFVVRYKRNQRTALENLMAIDWIGGILFTGGMTSLLVAVSWGGIQFPWRSAGTLVPLLVGIFAVAISLVWESRFPKHPLVRLSTFQNRSASSAAICAMLQGFLLYLGLYYLSLFFLSVKRQSPVQTGVAFLPLTLALLPTSVITGGFVTRTGRYRNLLWLGWILVALANGLLLLLNSSTKTVAWVFMFICAGVGQGIVISILGIVMQASVDQKYAADAAGLYTFMRSIGMALGVGIGSTVFQNRLSHQLSLGGLPAVIAENAAGFVQFLDALPASDASFTNSVLGAYDRAFHNLFELSTAVAGLALVLSLLIKQLDMNKAMDTSHALRRSVEGNDEGEVEKV